MLFSKRETYGLESVPYDVRRIVNDLKWAFDVKSYYTDSGGYERRKKRDEYEVASIQTPDDRIYILSRDWIIHPELNGRALIAAFSECNNKTYLYSTIDSMLTKLYRGNIYREGYDGNLSRMQDFLEYVKKDCVYR